MLIPKSDHTTYKQTTVRDLSREKSQQPIISQSMAALFAAGQRKKEADKQKDAEDKKRKVVIRYRAGQLIGENEHGPKSMKSGSKLIGSLINPIDTRAPSLVRVNLPHGGDASGVAIDPGSTLVGQFSYTGDGNRVYLKFSRIDSLDGGAMKISAVALDAGSFTPGIAGDEFTASGEKIATSIGLTMFSGMTDTLTDRESLGNSFNGVQAKPTMSNALLQGLSKASQDQASRTASEIEQERNYVIIPEGKEMIIELQEDFKK
jgi:hypothetical protein